MQQRTKMANIKAMKNVRVIVVVERAVFSETYG